MGLKPKSTGTVANKVLYKLNDNVSTPNLCHVEWAVTKLNKFVYLKYQQSQ